jgi:hypothetical protein
MGLRKEPLKDPTGLRPKSGKSIKIKHRRLVKHWGLAYPAAWTIELPPNLDDAAKVHFASHEALHVLMPWVSEEFVEFAARHLADVLVSTLKFRTEESD